MKTARQGRRSLRYGAGSLGAAPIAYYARGKCRSTQSWRSLVNGIGMSDAQIELCLEHLRAADAILMAEDELSLAVHLSLVIERLAERLEQE